MIFQNNDLQSIHEVRYEDIVQVDARRKLIGGRRVLVTVNRGQATFEIEMDFSGKPQAADFVLRFLREAMLHPHFDDTSHRAEDVPRNLPGASDVTVVTCGALVQRSLQAARMVEERSGISSEVIDLRTLSPFDMEAIATSVKKTNRVVIAYEDSLSWGIGAEFAARIADELFPWLDAPVRRVASLDTWVAYAPQLERAIRSFQAALIVTPRRARAAAASEHPTADGPGA